MSTRQDKVSRLIQKELGDIFQKDSAGLYNSALITVTSVRISPDLSFAKVFLSLFSPGKDTGEAFEKIKANTVKIRHTLGTRIRFQLRIVPELSFQVDDSLDYIEKIDTLLKK